MVVVLPEPLTPTTRITNGSCVGVDRERLRDGREHLLDFARPGSPSPRRRRGVLVVAAFARWRPRPGRRCRSRDRRGSALLPDLRSSAASSLRFVTRSVIASADRRRGAPHPAGQALPPGLAGRVCAVVHASAADLKFLQWSGRAHEGTSNRGAATRATSKSGFRFCVRSRANYSGAHDLFGEPESTSPDHAQSYIC